MHHGIDEFILFQMDTVNTVKIEPFADPAEQRTENLLFLLGRMRQMQSIGAPGLSLPGLKRTAEAETEQPLDFSAPAKHPRLSPVAPWLRVPDNKHDSLGSDAVSDVSSHSPRSDSDSQRPGSTSPLPPRSELPSLSIPSPVTDTTDCSINKSDSLLALAPKFPVLKPLSALTEPSSMPPMSFPFSSLPVFPQTQKPGFPPAQLPFPFPAAPATEMTKLSMDSQDKYNEFRERMMKNMEAGAKVKGRRHEVSTSSGTEDSNVSLDMSQGGGPQHHSTPTRDGKDAAYWERRRKNNEAAKRSRDARRMKENEVAVRASYLEQENIQLKMELVQLRTELGAMRDQITRRPLQQPSC